MDKEPLLPKFHSKLLECLKYPKHGTVLSGVFCSEAIDSSGEQISIKDMDISSLNDGTGLANTEHINPKKEEEFAEEKKDSKKNIWSAIVGRIIFAKKIFKESDCETKQELELWQELELPFVFGGVELFDSENHQGAADLAAMIRHYSDRGIPVVARYSIEGSILSREGNILKPTIARKVAITVKPCNHSATSSLVEMSNLAKKEDEIGGFSRVSFPIVEIDPIEDLIDGLDVLKKTWTGGGVNAAPTSLSQAGATATEYVAKSRRKEDILKNKALKYQLLAALRDWNKGTDLKTHLKHHLKEVDDKVVDKFTEAVEEFILPKSLAKSSREYGGKLVTPGEIKIISGPLSGIKLKSLYEDDKYVHVESVKSGDSEAVTINKIPKDKEGILWIHLKKPETGLIPLKAKGQAHPLNQTVSQTALIHKLRLEKPIHKRNFVSESSTEGKLFGWYEGEGGQKVLVKPEVKSDWDKGQLLSSVKREVIFYNLANEFFSLKRFVPTTAIFEHPVTDEEYSAMELIPDAEHYIDHDSNLKGRKSLKSAGSVGDLEKLAVMDCVLGIGDRHRLNYMISPKGVHLVDNASTFNWKSKSIPSYLLDCKALLGGIENAVITDSVHKWLASLDPFFLKELMTKMKVPEEYANESVRRLISMQAAIVDGKTKLLSVLFNHDELPHA